MGTPAEARNLVRHLINVSSPYSYDSPVWALVCAGVTELTEEFEADTEDVQYICETTKTVNVKGYTVGFDLEMGYIKDNNIQKYINELLRNPPTGSKTAGDYIRFNLDEAVEGKENVYRAVRRKAVVYPMSVGGAAEDSLTSSIHISGTSDPVNGYVTVTTTAGSTTFAWSETEPEVLARPTILEPSDGATNISLTPTIFGTGVSGATVEVSDGTNTLVSTTVNTSGGWFGTLSDALTANTEYTITAHQTLDGVTSSESEETKFTTGSN